MPRRQHGVDFSAYKVEQIFLTENKKSVTSVTPLLKMHFTFNFSTRSHGWKHGSERVAPKASATRSFLAVGNLDEEALG